MKKPDAHTVKDVPADNPEGTMERFNAGLRRVLAAPKPRKSQLRARKRKR